MSFVFGNKLIIVLFNILNFTSKVHSKLSRIFLPKQSFSLFFTSQISLSHLYVKYSKLSLDRLGLIQFKYIILKKLLYNLEPIEQ